MKKTTDWVLKHKLYALVVLVIVAGGSYFGYQKWLAKPTTVRYVTAAVERGVLTTSISGTGQVSASNEIDISTKASGEVTFVGVKVGDTVKASALLVSLNAREALKSVRDAQANLEAAKLSLQKLEQPAEAIALLQAENALTSAQENKSRAQDNIVGAFDDAYNTITSAFLNLPTIMGDLNSMLFGNAIAKAELGSSANYDNPNFLIGHVDFQDREPYQTLKLAADQDYQTARALYDTNLTHYQKTARQSDNETIENLLAETSDTAKAVTQASKSEKNFLDAWYDYSSAGSRKIFPLVQEYQSDLSADINQANSHISSLLSVQSTVKNNREAVITAERTIAEKTIALANLKAGADPLDLQSQRLAVKQRENALQDAQEKLTDYSARAKFDGVIAKLNVNKGDAVSGGASLGTLITKQRVATITLNEVDAAKVKVGQKATLTFDAIDNLNITGEVAEVDALGTTSQGVVSYGVKIAFDIQDDRIKSGMSVSASIILSSKSDVLMIASAAVKSQGSENYVEVLTNGILEKKTVAIGDNNDALTEILTGLNEGEEVVTQKITVGGSAAATSAKIPTTSGNNNRAVQGIFMGVPH